MHSTQEVFTCIRNGSNLADEQIKHHLSALDVRFKDFIEKLHEQDEQTKAAFQLVVQSALHGRQLTHEEKLEIETQLKELLKTADLVALTILPGGTVVLILSGFLKLNPYILPAVFLK